MDNKEILEEAKKRLKLAEELEAEFRKNAVEDLEFYSGDQWDPQSKRDRELTGRPALVINRIPAFVRQVTNEQRQNKPAIKVDPVSSGEDQKIADIYSGLIRNIEYISNADTHYDTAAWSAAVIGKGFLKVYSEYEDDNSFDQILKITSIANPLSVYMDPTSVMPDGSDAEWAMIIDEISQDEFKRRYPGEELDGFEEDSDWITNQTIKIAEYYHKEYKRSKLYHVRVFDPSTEETFDLITGDKPEIGEVIATRNITTPVVYKCIISGCKVLEKTIWETPEIPIVPVVGEQFFIKDKKFVSGVVRHLIDSQRTYNFDASLQEELIALSPKSPWIVADGQIEGHEHEWRDANTRNFAYLTYKPMSVSGQALPAPTRQSAEPAIVAVASTRQTAAEDMKAITGIYDPSLGAQGNETSGRAILARQEQTSTSNFHYVDNLIRSIRRVGHILVNAIPKYYDTERAIRVIKPDNKQEIINVNDGEIDLTTGKFDVVVQTGPAYSTRRQEAVESMMALATVNPSALPLYADLMVGNMDWPGAELISERLKTQVPPEVLAITDEQTGADPKVQVQQLQGQMKQMSQQLELAVSSAEQLKLHGQNLFEENKLLKQKSSIDVEKAQMDNQIEQDKLILSEHKIELEGRIRLKELQLQERQLELQERQLQVKAVGVMSDIESTLHDRDFKGIGTIGTIGTIDIPDSAELNEPGETDGLNGQLM